MRAFTMAAALTAGLAGVTGSAAAQRIYDVSKQPPRFYFSGGLGAATFTPTCDTGCFGNALNANNVILYAGWAFSERIRLEVGVQHLPATGEEGSGSHTSSASLGASVYLVKHLFVRGGVSAISVSVLDTVGVSEGHGGPGYTVGAGYDVFLGRSFAITPFVNCFGGTISDLSYQAGAGSTATKGRVTALDFGVSFTYRPFRRT